MRAIRNTAGSLPNFDELKNVDGANSGGDLLSMKSGLSLGNFTIRNVDIVGPKVGAQLRRQAILATLYALVGMLVYIAFRFEWVYGAAAVIAVFHDVLITLGFLLAFSLRNFADGDCGVADPGWIFDERYDRHLRPRAGKSPADAPRIVYRDREQVHQSDVVPHDSHERSDIFDGLVLYIMGGEVLRAFSFAMVVGVVVGTYSSFGIAAPIVVFWNKHWGQGAFRPGVIAGTSGLRAGSAADKRVVAAARR